MVRWGDVSQRQPQQCPMDLRRKFAENYSPQCTGTTSRVHFTPQPVKETQSLQVFVNIREVPRWPDYEQNTAQNTHWKNGTNQSVKSNPRLRIEAGWYVADRIRIRIEPPHAFDCRKRAKRNRIRNLINLAVRNSANTCRLSGSSIRNRIRNLQSAEPLYYKCNMWNFQVKQNKLCPLFCQSKCLHFYVIFSEQTWSLTRTPADEEDGQKQNCSSLNSLQFFVLAMTHHTLNKRKKRQRGRKLREMLTL